MKKFINPILMVLLAGLIVWVFIQPHLGLPGGTGLGDDGEVNKGLPTVQVKLGNRVFTLEVADTEHQRQLGLMNRKSMPDDHGMIFVFQEDLELSFWMNNTLIPLDVIYVDSKGKVANIDQMEARDTTTKHPSNGEVRYAIELNKGMSAKVGLKAGDTVEVPKLD
jgi:uncharacterized protein